MTRSVRSSIAVLGALLPLLLVPRLASADPILSFSPTSIAHSPTQTVITFNVDPNGMLVAGISLNLSSSASDLLIVGIQSLDAEIAPSPQPFVPGGNASFSGLFLSDRSAPFDVGTLTLEGFTPGAPLVAGGTFTISDGLGGFSDIFFGPIDVATVATPEPTSAALLALGLLALAGRRSRRR